MCDLCSKDDLEIRSPVIGESANINHSTNLIQNGGASNNANATPTTSDSADIKNESSPLLNSKNDVDHASYKGSVDEPEEHITFADIPMPGLWIEDKPGKNTDRIIILLFVLLASMIVVSIVICGKCNEYVFVK